MRYAVLEEVGRFCELLDAMGVAEDEAVLDVTIARGLAYYTGPVFETQLLEAPDLGSVCSGGRYDDLVGRFSGQPWPGTGTSVGIDRLLDMTRTAVNITGDAAVTCIVAKGEGQLDLDVFEAK